MNKRIQLSVVNPKRHIQVQYRQDADSTLMHMLTLACGQDLDIQVWRRLGQNGREVVLVDPTKLAGIPFNSKDEVLHVLKYGDLDPVELRQIALALRQASCKIVKVVMWSMYQDGADRYEREVFEDALESCSN
tara:strand:+ start:4924 stop:5322 length:399 start_codon:yes stop_codon:yes gene_type:complete